ncbi:WecB/TagA/CpsF family glycosyltransferase [Candidatus Falkowbacteria bacterium]|uniref:Nudix hydrolase domain-containing protein n=1 Tax=Candidatus Falkowbacteria bacterium CG10_big_fil_rev_8_21_14_0_10_37_18 TaxID=1974562 RepID=A0A2H0V9A2_9BACT|nr:WecB/TagA/CpsF family glycosyltransferase [Candidatus Falkowbacteria bacterium]NCQ12472.1 WecB/TagA/CpsF family glycosyltransferase [Candidatus Falkowbacteria bacterium]OIO06095.1 MAG: hypothetical protein AUJ26_01680 [Candidatus Falkowbacteria bacterium CG1_02_37_21]PIR95668.1 MAG: hypothetical protein COT93_00880 [Candidatus Falkowbacteria bacterium CG10_big_fil_rev_8_21_14_0_10_37_18]
MANILGINLGEYSPTEVLEKSIEFLKDGEQHYIVTPNPEIILTSHQDEELFYILNRADLSLADGFGLKIAAWLFGEQIFRQTGADLTKEILEVASQKNIKIVILNWKNGLSSAQNIKDSLNKQYPALNVLVIDAERDKALSAEINIQINNFSPTILFNTFGCPYQEKNIYHGLKNWPSVKLALAVGGSFDYITGRAKRAPKIFRQLGIEWLWRLIRQPRRLKRIYNATCIFLTKVMISRFVNPHLYRPNVACMLYKKEKGINKILVVERNGEPNHWQIPQGGLDGETPEIAGAREIEEETHAVDFVVKGVFKNLIRYEFSGKGRDYRPDIQRPVYEGKKYKFDYKGQKQSLYIAEFTGQDDEIKINFWDHSNWQWVDEDKLVETVHTDRQANTKIFLEKFKSLNL